MSHEAEGAISCWQIKAEVAVESGDDMANRLTGKTIGNPRTYGAMRHIKSDMKGSVES
jgi:hypothetical protein